MDIYTVFRSFEKYNPFGGDITVMIKYLEFFFVFSSKSSTRSEKNNGPSPRLNTVV